MKSTRFRKSSLKQLLVLLLVASLCLLQTPIPSAQAMVEESTPPTKAMVDDSLHTEDQPSGDLPEYVPGELIVKLKEGHTLAELDDFRQKYQILGSEPVFRKVVSPEAGLAELKKRREALENPDHSGWYWWKDKESKESKDYEARVAKEKEDLDRAIEAKEQLIGRLQARQKRAPEGSVVPSLEGIHLLKTAPDADISSLVAVFQSHPAVEYAQPNYKYELSMVPNDPYYSSRGSWKQSYDDLWGLKPNRLNCEAAWDETQGEGVLVGVLDTGIDYNHPDLAANVYINEREIAGNGIDDDNNGLVDDVRGFDFSDNDADVIDTHGHGSHVSGTIAAVGN
jgi:hypothetical protein